MNAAERAEVAKYHRSSFKVKNSLDFSNTVDRPMYIPSYRKEGMTTNCLDTFRHGVCFDPDSPFDKVTITTHEFHETNDPCPYKPNSYFKDLSKHPECRPTYKPPTVTEVSVNMNNYGNISKEDTHPRCLKQTMHTEYTKCGETVNRGYDRSSYFPDQTMGEPNIKEPDDCVDGYLDAAFKDKGYSLKRIEVPKEQIERKLNTYYTEDDRIPKDLPPAGLETKFGGNVKDMLSTYYGWGRKTQRSELGPDPNLKNDTSVVHGYKPKINDVKPGYLGGPRAGGDLENYVRIVE